MPFSIRTFRNTDVDALCQVWNEHFSDQGVESQITPLRLELGCLAKPYFESSELFLAESDSKIIGFAHLAPVPNETWEEVAVGEAAIPALCVIPHPDEQRMAIELLNRSEVTAHSLGAIECQFKPMLPNGAYYLGMGPADSMIGLTSGEQRACAWMHAAGFQPLRPTNQWELELSRFQPPSDRLQIQVRRSAHVDRQVDEPMLPWWQACVLGHTEPTAFQLTDRHHRRVLNEVLFWTIASELQSLPHSIAWLWPPNVDALEFSESSNSDVSSIDRLVFLLAESLRDFQSEGIDLVRTSSVGDDVATSQLLKRLGFKPKQSGIVFRKRLPQTSV